jgi:GxGYxY sequence motif in domain of unknown function N-terminal
MPSKIYVIAAFAAGIYKLNISAQNRVNPVPADRLYPKTTAPATSLIVVDLGADKIDGQVAACGLQGIINRDSKQKIYVTNTWCYDNHGGWNEGKQGERVQAEMGSVWLTQLFSKLPHHELKRDISQHDPGFLALLAQYKSAIKGIIIYDPQLEDATIEAATTIAGQTDGLILSPELAEQVKAYDFPVIADLRGKFKNDLECLDWLKANYFAKANKQVAFTWSHMNSGPQSWGGANKDYVVANRLFTYYLNIEDANERSHYADVVKLYPPGTPIMGWTNELSADHLFATYGYFMVPCIAVENLSVMSSFPSVKGTQPAPKAYPVRNNAVYIACLVSDGDNLLHSMIYEPYTMLNSKNYGVIPTTWIINPGISDLAPKVYQWMLGRLGNQELGAMMGDGSPGTDRFAGYSFYCDLAKHYITQAGIKTMKQMLDADPVAWRVQPYAINSGYAGTDARGVGPYEFHLNGGTFNVGTTNMKPELLYDVIDSAKKGPLFLSVFFGGAHRDVPTEIKELAEKLQARHDGKKYYFVRTMDLAATYRAWKGLPVQ